MSGKQIIINDNFQTKVCNLSTIADLGRVATLPYGHPTKEIISIDIDDPVYYNVVKRNSVDVVNYIFDPEDPKPEHQDQSSWKSYKVISPISVNQLPDNLKTKYPNGLSIGDVIPDTIITHIILYSNSSGNPEIKRYTFDDIRFELPSDLPAPSTFTNGREYEKRFDYSEIINHDESLINNFIPFEKNYFQYQVNTIGNGGIYYPSWKNRSAGTIPYNYLDGKLSQGVTINVTSPGGASSFFYFCPITGYQDSIITDNKAGDCEFKIGVPPIVITRNQGSTHPYYYFNTIQSINYEYFKTKKPYTPGQSDRDYFGFISWGHYKGGISEDNFRFILAFQPRYNQSTQKFEIYVSDLTSDAHFNEENKIMIPNWDGNSLISFHCEYFDDRTTEAVQGTHVKGAFYYKINDTDDWTYLKTFGPSNIAFGTEEIKNSVLFGHYGNNQECTFTLNSLKVKSYDNNGYNVYYQDKFYENLINFFSDIKEKFTFRITGDINENNKLKVHWFYNKIDELSSTVDISPNYSDFGSNYALAKSRYDLLTKKAKNIKFTADKGSITEIDFSNKKIYKINISDLINLSSINLNSNNLSFLDLSQNINLSYINTTNNPELTSIIFPKKWNKSDIIINCDNKLSKFDLYNSNEEQINVTLNLDNTNDYKSLILRNVNIQNIDEFLEYQYSNIKFVDITNTNILNDIDYLRIFVNNLSNRTNKEPGKIYLYGNKYIVNGIKGSSKDIANILEILKLKNWLFYV